MKIFGIEIPKEIYAPIIIILASFFLEKIIKLIIKKALSPRKNSKKIDRRKSETLKSLFCNIVKYVIWIIAFLSILGVYGVNTAALVTSLGVLSFVVGLAFQDILKDILAGASILFENQFAVGDLIKVNDFKGLVISVGLKTTRIQAFTGEIKIISNRNITDVINYSLDNTFAVVDVPVSYETDVDKAEKILKVCCATMKSKIKDLVDEPEVWGVQELDSSSVNIRIVGKCKPATHFGVERQMKKEFKKTLDKNNIKIPYMQIEVHNEH